MTRKPQLSQIQMLAIQVDSLKASGDKASGDKACEVMLEQRTTIDTLQEIVDEVVRLRPQLRSAEFGKLNSLIDKSGLTKQR